MPANAGAGTTVKRIKSYPTTGHHRARGGLTAPPVAGAGQGPEQSPARKRKPEKSEKKRIFAKKYDMKRVLLFIITLSMAAMTAAQSQHRMTDGGAPAGRWERIDTLMVNAHFATAYPLTQGYYREALVSGTGPEILTAAFYLTLLDHAYNKEANDSALARYSFLARRLQGADRAVAYTFLFNAYHAIYYSNYYYINYRNKVSDDPNLKYPLWHRQRMIDTLMRCADSVLAYADDLRATSIEPYGRLFPSDSTLPPSLDSTLLGLLAQTLLFANYVNFDASEISSTLRGEILKPLPQFAQNPAADTLPYPLPLHHRVAKLYASGSADRMLWLDLKRFDLIDFDSNTIQNIEGLAEYYAGPSLPVLGREMKAQLGFYRAKYLSKGNREAEAEQVCLATEQAYPDTYGARKCRLLRLYDICLPQIGLHYSEIESSQRNRVACVEARNIPMLSFRLVDASGTNEYQVLTRDTLMSLTPVKEWQQPLPDPGDHQWHQYLVALPAVPQGDYYLLAYTDSLFCYEGYKSADATFIFYSPTSTKGKTLLHPSSGHLVDRLTGEPLAGKRVTLHGENRHSRKDRHRHCRTDKEGYFHFPVSSPDYRFVYYHDLSATVNGYEHFINWYVDTEYDNRGGGRIKYLDLVMTDRPVYRLGDTVHFSCVAYCRHLLGKEEQQRIRLAKHVKLVASFGQYSGEKDTLYLTTDKHGRCWGEFVIPPDGKNGRYRIEVYSPERDMDYYDDVFYSSLDIKVEAYKPPRFMVTLSRYPDSTVQTGAKTSFGQPVTLYGSAVSYSGAPMAGAKVKWDVTCDKMRTSNQGGPLAYKGYLYRDSLTVGVDGRFQFTFTPERPAEDGTYFYTACVRVMDADGELHEQRLSFTVGDADGYCMVTGDDLSHLTFVYNDFADKPLEGSVHVELYQLRQPDTVRTLDPIMTEFPKAKWIGSKAEFQRLFPYRAFSREEGDRHAWPVVAKRFSTATTERTLDIPGIPSGLYRITFRTPDGNTHDTLVNHVAPKGRVTGNDVVWLRTTPERNGLYDEILTCRVGDTVRIEMGSPYGNQPLYYLVIHAGKIYQKGMMVLDSSHTSTLLVPITKKMKDGCTVHLSAVREGRNFTAGYTVLVTRPEMKLDISTETFRDRLQPGEQEQWTFRVDNSNGEVNMTMTLYDQSLDQYGHQKYGFFPWVGYRYMNFHGSIEEFVTHSVKPSATHINPYNLSASPSLGFTLFDQKEYFRQLIRRFSVSGCLQGTIVDAKTQEPVPFVSIVVISKGRQVEKTVTDFDGKFVFRDLLPGTYRIEYSSLGYHKFIQPAVKIDGQSLVVLDVPLQSSATQLNEVLIIESRIPKEAARPNIIEIGAAACSSRISSEDIARMPSNSVESIVAAVGGIGYSDGTSSRKRGGVNVPKEAIAEISPMFNFDGSASDSPVALRKNLSTLAFFEPALNSDKEGRVTVSFTLPDALTQWRLLGFAWNDRFQMGSIDRTVYSQKELMVQPLMPRFLRQGDTVVIPAKVSNLTDSTLAVKVDFSFESLANSQFVDLPPHSSAIATMRLAVPDNWHSATYKVSARGGRHSDGEQGVLPVLSNRERITTSHLLYVPGSADGKEVTRTFNITLPPAAEGDSTVIAFTANPVDYAIRALPHFKRLRMPGNIYLANSIYVGHLTTLLDTLPPKEKSRLKARVESDLRGLLYTQLPQGGWSWMPGGKTPSRYVTESILQRLAACPMLVGERRQYLRAVNYLDNILVDGYAGVSPALGPRATDLLSLLYTRSLYLGVKPLAECDSLTQEAYRSYLGYLKMNIGHTETLYAQGQAALLFLHTGDTAEAVKMATRIRESAHVSDEMGMYWNSNTSGYGWYQRPIETAAMMVKVFAEVLEDWESVNRIQQWILASKQGTTWRTDMATAYALAALLTQPENQNQNENQNRNQNRVSHSSPKLGEVPAGRRSVSSNQNGNQITLRCNGEEIPLTGRTQEYAPTLNFQLTSTSPFPAWGAVFHSHDTPIDSIQYNGTGMSIRKTLSRVNADGSLTSLSGRTQEYAPTLTLQAGERIRVHIDIDCARDFDNMVLSDQRAAALEPVSTASGWRWNDGLRYYVDVRDEGVNCYIDHLGEGHYYVEYDLWVRHSGTFSGGICTLHSVYAPEFRANSASEKLRVGKK